MTTSTMLSTPKNKKLTPDEVALVQEILVEARAGRATLTQLARAHDLANEVNLNGTLGELREHIRRAVPRPPLKDEAKAVLLGFISGVFTHVVLTKRHE
jgi:hypothetical protein